MSRIEESLKKLRAMQASAVPSPDRPVAIAGRTVVPAAKNKKVTLDGEKHHVSQEDLIRGGLLTLDQAVPVADQFRRIKRPLIANAAKGRQEGGADNMNIIMIASALPGAGKTFCAVNLAASISLERELNVLLVDADVAKPHISRAFGLENAPGLIDLILNDKLDIGETLVRTDLNDIQVLPAGQKHSDATELLASDRMSHIVRELAVRYPDRIVLLDSPPLMSTSEAQALSSQVGQIVLVVEAGQTSQRMLQQTIEVLDSTKAISVILNKVFGWRHKRYYGGDYGHYPSG